MILWIFLEKNTLFCGQLNYPCLCQLQFDSVSSQPANIIQLQERFLFFSLILFGILCGKFAFILHFWIIYSVRTNILQHINVKSPHIWLSVEFYHNLYQPSQYTFEMIRMLYLRNSYHSPTSVLGFP